MSEHDRLIAMETCRRSMAARGMLDASGAAVGSLALTVAIRARPTMIAIADRTHGGRVSHRYLYGSGDGLLLEEQVDAGAHTFTLCSRSLAADRLATYVDPEERAPESDEEAIVRRGDAVGQGWDDVTAAVGEVETVTQLFSTRAGPRESARINLSVVVGTRALAAVGGYGPPPDRPRAVEPVISTRVLSRSSLTALLEIVLDQTPLAVMPPGADKTGRLE